MDEVPVVVRWTKITVDDYELVLAHGEALARFGDADPAVIAGLLSSSRRHSPYLGEWEDSSGPQVTHVSSEQHVAVRASAPVLVHRVDGKVWVTPCSWPGGPQVPEQAGPFADEGAAVRWCLASPGVAGDAVNGAGGRS